MLLAYTFCRDDILAEVVALLVLIVLQQQAPPPDLPAISAALREQRYPDALALTKQALKTDDGNPQIWTLQGLAEAGLNQWVEALEDFHRACAIAPDYLPALKAEAQLEYATHNPKAIQTLRHIVALEPHDPVSHAMLGSLAYQRHDCRGVVANYAAGARVIETQPGALTEYAECLFQSGRRSEALGAFAKAAALNPKSWQAHYNVAVAQLVSGRPAEALRVIQPFLVSPEAASSPLLDLAASVYEQMGDTPHAVSTLRQAILGDPTNSALYLHFADLSFAHNSFEVGISMLNAGFQKIPKSAPLYLARGILYVQMGQYEKADADFSKAAQIDPTQAFSSVAESLTQLQRSDLDGALASTKEQLKRTPGDGYLHYLKAETLRQKGVEPGTAAFGEALAAAETAIRLKPNFPLAEDLLGTFYLRENKLEAASRQFEKVLQSEPENESALYHLILVSRKRGRAKDLPALMKRLSDAKTHQKNLEERRNRYTFVEPGKAH